MKMARMRALKSEKIRRYRVDFKKQKSGGVKGSLKIKGSVISTRTANTKQKVFNQFKNDLKPLIIRVSGRKKR